MTTKEYWLIKLAEELGEVQKDVFKALTFGLDDREPGQTLTNKERIRNELCDVSAVLSILENDHGIVFDDYEKYNTHMSNEVSKAVFRKSKYYNVSVSLGIVKDEEK